MTQELKEVLISFNVETLEAFNEATKDCNNEQKIAIAKRIAESDLPEGWLPTKADLRRGIVFTPNWYPGIEIGGPSKNTTITEAESVEAQKQSDAAMGDLCGFTPEQRATLGLAESSPISEAEIANSETYRQLMSLGTVSEDEALALVKKGFQF